jgi:hypothetical protein
VPPALAGPQETLGLREEATVASDNGVVERVVVALEGGDHQARLQRARRAGIVEGEGGGGEGQQAGGG